MKLIKPIEIGKRFGRLIILEYMGHEKNKALVKAICDCGYKDIYYLYNLRNGNTKSCGCYQKQQVSLFNTTHNKSETKEYRAWDSMRERCLNLSSKSFPNYGGRGIKICDRWIESFENFLEDMGEKLDGTSLDRIDNNKGYCKENCRWATPKQQNGNRRDNKWHIFNGKKFIQADLAKKFGVCDTTITNKRNEAIRKGEDNFLLDNNIIHFFNV